MLQRIIYNKSKMITMILVILYLIPLMKLIIKNKTKIVKLIKLQRMCTYSLMMSIEMALSQSCLIKGWNYRFVNKSMLRWIRQNKIKIKTKIRFPRIYVNLKEESFYQIKLISRKYLPSMSYLIKKWHT